MDKKEYTNKFIDNAIEVLQAYKDGKTIEWCNSGRNDWATYQVCDKFAPSLQFDFMHYDYRVKVEPKYRPYANAEECLNAQKEHGPHILYDKFGYNIITQIEQDSIWINPYQHHQKISFGKLVNYKWQDGTPCGILEE